MKKTGVGAILTASVASVMLASACGSTEEKPDEQASRQQDAQEQAAGFSQPSVERGKQKITTERKVTRTVEVQTEIPTVRRTTEKADINRMNVEHFVVLGFPQEVARNIVEYREDRDGFQSVEELQQVQGMTPELFSSLSGKLGVSQG